MTFNIILGKSYFFRLSFISETQFISNNHWINRIINGFYAWLTRCTVQLPLISIYIYYMVLTYLPLDTLYFLLAFFIYHTIIDFFVNIWWIVCPVKQFKVFKYFYWVPLCYVFLLNWTHNTGEANNNKYINFAIEFHKVS